MEQGTGKGASVSRDDDPVAQSGFRKLLAWQKADDLAAEALRIAEEEILPKHRWLSVQLSRAAFSVTANISEGYGRSSLGDYLRFLEIAGASLNEVENALHFIRRNKVLPAGKLSEADDLRRATGNLLFGLIRALRAKQRNNETWQRGLIGEERAEYHASSWNDEFLVPGSQFQDPEVFDGEG